MEYSKQLGAITDAQIQQALNHFNLGELLRAEPVPFGLFGQNVFVTSTAGQYVLRGAPHTPSQFPAEQYYTGELHRRTSVPVSWPYLIDESRAIFGWSYVLMPRMPGINVDDREVRGRLSDTDRIAIARAMAENLVAMQSLTHSETGRWDLATNTIRPFDLEHEIAWWFPRAPLDQDETRRIGSAEQIEGLIRTFARRSKAADHGEDLDWVERVLAAAHDALRILFEPCFVMEDYKLGNVVLSDTAGRWRVSGVFDLAGSYFGDGESDLSRTVASYLDENASLAREFLLTYLKLRPARDGFAERFRAYMLHDRLIIWDYVQRHEPEVAAKMGSLRDWAERYVEALAGLY
ncbi:MAG: phosphotransferase [Candidatus Binatus sp.]|uniref:phosphotransferase family protein n=1 Tax=Candidatus Binatus sp. TaxID=2811406 RepID=UPI00271AAAB7|nr:phosphotransferase [Candidatus Binatus sp.]MDO8432026.1 phosphotransferase [Candidatus Binatus sp.]